MTTDTHQQTAVELMDSFPAEPLSTPAANIRRCMQQTAKAKDYAAANGYTQQERRKLAIMAYKLAMPPMTDKPAIHSYIACVAYGIQVGVFNGRDASQLLYAAQVALSLLKEPKEAGRPRLAARQTDGGRP